MITHAEIEAADYTEVMPDTCDVTRHTKTGTDALNNDIYTWAVIENDVKCRREVEADDEDGREVYIDTQVVRADYKFYVEPGTDVTEKDRIVFGGGTYEVLYVEPFQDIDGQYTKEVFTAIVR